MTHVEPGLGGRTALVTGASECIRRAIAARLAAEGRDLHIASRTRDALEADAKQIQSGLGARMQVTCRKVLDQSKSNSVGMLFDAAGRVDILVKKASAIPGDDLQRFNTTRWRAARHHGCRAVTVASASEYFFPKLPYRSF